MGRELYFLARVCVNRSPPLGPLFLLCWCFVGCFTPLRGAW